MKFGARIWLESQVGVRPGTVMQSPLATWDFELHVQCLSQALLTPWRGETMIPFVQMKRL